MATVSTSIRRTGQLARSIDPFTWLAGLVGVVFIALLVYTVGGMVVRLFLEESTREGSAFSRALGGRGLTTALRNSGIVLLTAVPLALLVGAAFAWLNERTDAALGWVSRILPLVPFLLPPIALSVGWIFLGSENAGLLNAAAQGIGSLFGVEVETPFNIATWPGLIFVYTLHLVPYAYLIIAAALRNLDGSQDEASRMSGAGVFRTAARVTLPSVLPAIGSAALLVVVISLALFSIPSIVGASAGITVLPVYIFRLVREAFPPRLDEAVVLSTFVLIVVSSMWLLQRRLARRGQHSMIGGKGARSSVITLGKWKWVARTVILLYLLATSILPIFALLMVALQPFWTPDIQWASFTLSNFEALLADRSPAREALFTSGGLGVLGATAGMLVAAVLMVYARQRGGSTSRLIDGGTKLPGAMSHIVLGVAFVVTMSGAPFYLQGTIWILLLAYVLTYMPQASVAAGSASDQIGNDLLEASQMSGASVGRTFRRVTLPLMIPGLAAGWALLFVVMAGDLTVSAMLAGTSNPVVGFVILNIWENGTYSVLAALSIMISLMSTVAVGSVLFLSSRANRPGKTSRPVVGAVPTG